LAWAQKAEGTYRVRWLGSSAEAFREPYAIAFAQRLAELGFVEGKNLVIERRHAESRIEKLPAVAAELAKHKCDVFFTSGTDANLAALAPVQRQTPIVLVAVDFDPIATGDVASLSHPGGRVTGITALQSALPAKRLELMKEMLPNLSRLSVFTNEQTAAQLSLAQGTARRLGLALHVVDFKRPPFNYEAGFADAVRAKSEALLVLGSGLWVPARRLIPELALKAKLPSAFHHAQWVESGGLMSYGFNFSAMWRRSAEIVARILRGAKPGELPMEQPTSLELALNLRTAKALGLSIPAAVLARADRVIE
jgi:putative ABC transport system substrate-binding protein